MDLEEIERRESVRMLVVSDCLVRGEEKRRDQNFLFSV
jgi:hypothetical protein